MRRKVLVFAGIAALLGVAMASNAAEARSSFTRTETAEAYITGFGPERAGLGAYRSDLLIDATRTTMFDTSGRHVVNTWSDTFTLYDPATDQPSLSCKVTGALPAEAVNISSDLTVATLDGSAGAMTPNGDPATGFDDNAACPTISLRVIMAWHAVSDLRPADVRDLTDRCRPWRRTVTANAIAVGVTLNAPASPSPSAIQHDPSVRASISATTTFGAGC